MDPAAIGPAVAGADAVLSAIGPHGSGPTTVSQDSAAAIIAAMHAAGARRLIIVSGSVVTDVGDDPFLRLVKPLVRRTQLRHVCADMRRAEDEVRSSGLDWTIMRPPRLTDKAAAGTYRTAIDRNLPREYTISRADLAGAFWAWSATGTACTSTSPLPADPAIFAAACNCTYHTFPGTVQARLIRAIRAKGKVRPPDATPAKGS